ncbi:MAG: phage/plasmid primase, P4 family, partial [Eubacterium sp.]
NILQEAMGLMISPHASEVQTSFAFLGNGSNGKSALMLIMQALFPSTDFIASIGLSDFAGDFDIAQAEGKQVNMVMDDDMTGVKVGKSFKSMICGEPVRVNRKNRDIKTLSFNLTHFFGLNRLPSIIDKTLGFYRRFCIIPFTNTFGALEDVTAGNATKVKNPSITKAIIEKEADIVFNWALQGLHRLKENNWKLSTSKASNMAMEQYKEETDSAYSFFKMCITLKEGSKISCNELYQSYVVYCSNSGIKNCLNQNNLGRQLSLYGISRRRGKERYYTDIEINHKTFNY